MTNHRANYTCHSSPAELLRRHSYALAEVGAEMTLVGEAEEVGDLLDALAVVSEEEFGGGDNFVVDDLSCRASREAFAGSGEILWGEVQAFGILVHAEVSVHGIIERIAVLEHEGETLEEVLLWRKGLFAEIIGFGRAQVIQHEER